MISFLPWILGNVWFSGFLVLTCHGFGFFSIFFLDVFTDVAGRKKEFFFLPIRYRRQCPACVHACA